MQKFLVLWIMLSVLVVSLSAQAQPASDSKFPLFQSAAAAHNHCPFDVVVWLNTKTDLYNLAGPQQGDTKDNGAFMCQREADQMGYQMQAH